MAIQKILAIYLIFLGATLLTEPGNTTEIKTLLPIGHTEFIAIKENSLARRLTGLVSQVGKLRIDGLIQYTLVIQPEKGMPLNGWPVIIFNHGFHPEPFMNGRRTMDGVTDRPGVYYRQKPQALGRHGFLVAVPDYRGHNDSSGAEFTLQESSPLWYARDVLGIITALEGIDNADVDHLFMLGHSMGAQVILRVAATLGDKLEAASIWSTYIPTGPGSNNERMQAAISRQLQLIHSPLNIHHAKGHQTTAFAGSTMIANQLVRLCKPYEFYSYVSDNHLFINDNLNLAITGDIAFSRHIMLTKNKILEASRLNSKRKMRSTKVCDAARTDHLCCFCIRSTISLSGTYFEKHHINISMALISDTNSLDPFILRRSEMVPCRTAFIDARTPGSDQKENFCLIGAGVTENPDQVVHINMPHGFDVGAARQPRGCKNSHHSHDTEEVFIVHQGQWKFTWGEDGSDGETILSSGDIISIPTQLFRGFENVGDDNGFLFSVLGHLPNDTPGSVTWAPYVFTEAKQYGLVLLKNGQLIDTHSGQTVPSDQDLYSPVSGKELEAFSTLTLEDMSKNIKRNAEYASHDTGGLTNEQGAQEYAVIGSQNNNEHMPAGKISRPHNFQLRRLMLDCGATVAKHSREEPEVLFVHRGSLTITTDKGAFTLGTGDLFTCPIGLSRSFINESNEPVDIIIVRGGDNPSEAIFD